MGMPYSITSSVRAIRAHMKREERVQVEFRTGWVHLCISV